MPLTPEPTDYLQLQDDPVNPRAFKFVTVAELSLAVSEADYDSRYLRKDDLASQTVLSPVEFPTNGFKVGTNQILTSGGRVGVGRTPLIHPLEVQGDILTTGSFRGDGSQLTGIAIPTAAAPTAQVGLTTVNGSAATFMRSDAAPALNQGITPTWTALHTFGTGDNQQMWGNITTGQRLLISKGTAASPDTNTSPLIKVQRTIHATDASAVGAGIAGDGGENFAAGTFICVGVNNTEVQPVGVCGFAKNDSTSNSATDTSKSNDACGVYGVGRITSNGTGVAIGGFFRAQRDYNSSRYTGVEIQVYNGHADATIYSTSGYASSGVWLNALGLGDTAAGILISNPFGLQFTNGIAFTAEVNGGKTGGISYATFRDDSHSQYSVLIGGSHIDGLNTFGATLSGSAVLMALGHKVTWGTEISLTRSASNTFTVTTGGSARFSVGNTFASLGVNLIFNTDNANDVGGAANRARYGYFGTAIGIGTTSMTHALNVVGDTRTDNLISNGTTFSLVNTVATTVNFAGASTALTIGAVTGIATIRNATVSLSGTLLDAGTPYNTDIGQLTRKFKTLYAAELSVETLVAQNTMATIGGRILVGPTTSLIADLAPASGIINVKHNNLASGDRVYLEANGQVEFLAITSGATAIAGGYSYTVSRNLDTTGANQWYAGDAVFNTGTTGSGWIDIYSIQSIKGSSQPGPTMVGNIRNSSTYNDWSEAWAVGNLNGTYGYSATTFGAAFGKYINGSTFVSIDATNGFRAVSRSGGVNTVRVQVAADGSAFFGNGNLSVSAIGVLTVGSWTVNSSTLTGTSVTLDSAGKFTLGSGTDVAILDAVDTTYRLAIGHSTYASAPFRVTKAGALSATGATISGAIIATSGSITGTMSITGALTAGGGNVVMSSDGLSIKLQTGGALSVTNSITWQDESTVGVATIFADKASASNSSLQGYTVAGTTTGNANVIFYSQNSNGTQLSQLKLVTAAGTPTNYAVLKGTGTYTGLIIGADAVPTAMLDVRGTGIFSGAVTLSGGVNGNVAFDTNTLFINATDNRVGIGTASPTSGFVLDVIGSIRTTGGFTMPTAGSPCRLITVVADWSGLTQNTTFNGSNWLLDDTTKSGWFFKLDSRAASSEWAVWRVPSGSNPHSDERAILLCKNDDTVVIKTPNAIPTDSNLNAASITWYLDQTNHLLKVRVKYSDGTTMKTGQMALI